MKSRTSGLIRGIQISDHPGWKFYEDGDPNLLNVSNQTVIFIRNINVDVAAYLRKKGNRVGFDLLDRPVADQHNSSIKDKEIQWNRYNYDIDFFIVNNSLMKDALQRVNIKIPIHVIPHHTVNFERKKINFRDRVLKVGYVGLEDQFSFRNETEKFLSGKGIQFLSCHPNTREEVSNFIQNLDIGLILVENDSASLWKKYILDYKPNTKLSNFQSFGVPTIASPYRSFKEFGEDRWIESNSKEDSFQSLELLINDVNKRYNLSKESLEIGEKFHIENIRSLYRNL